MFRLPLRPVVNCEVLPYVHGARARSGHLTFCFISKSLILRGMATAEKLIVAVIVECSYETESVSS